MDHRRRAEWSPTDEDRRAADPIDDHLPSIEETDRICLGLAIQFDADNEYVVRPVRFDHRFKRRVVDGEDCIPAKQLSEVVWNWLTGGNRIMDTFGHLDWACVDLKSIRG